MKASSSNNDEFYVGYIPSAPDKTSAFIKRVVAILFLCILIIAATLVTHQRNFSTSEFEYGINTTLSGELMMKPVPHLRVKLGVTFSGNSEFQNVLLVAAGKKGADELVKSGFKEHSLAKVSGFLIYGDGKTLLQVNGADDLVINETNLTNSDTAAQLTYARQILSVSGEIVDPKCYLGVMKPSEGKVHRSCAIRCLAGGIPAVFKSDSSDYFLLLDENLNSLNSQVLDIVGDHVTIVGEVVEFNDWKILKVDSRKMKVLTQSSRFKRELIATEAGMTFCGH